MNFTNTFPGKYFRKVKYNGTDHIIVWKVDEEGVWFNYPIQSLNRSKVRYFKWPYFNRTFIRPSPKDNFEETGVE
jgi:hypothetical protein